MNISLQNTDALNAVLTVTLATEDYFPQTEQALAKYRKNFAMKGFRKGMVPAGLVKKMYGTSVMLEEVNRLLTDAVNKYVEEQDLQILGRPMPIPSDADFDINHPVEYAFSFELGLVPEINLDVLNTSTVIKTPKAKIDDEQLEKELDNIRMRYGNMTFPESGIEEKDILQVKIIELEGDQPKAGGVEATGPINLEIVKDAKLKTKLLKAKVGDSFNIRLFDAIDRDRDQIIKHILGLKETPAELGEEFSITIERISRMGKAELNQEFFDKVFGPGKATDEASAKEALRKELENYVGQTESGKLNERIFNYILDNTQITLPDDFLKRWIKSSNEKPLSDEQLEEEYPTFARNLRWSLIVNKISKENNLQGTFEEIKEASKDALRKQFEMYNPGGEGISDQDLDMFNANMLSKEEHVKKTYDVLMEQKLFNFIKEKITVEEDLLPLDEFFKS